MSFQFTPFVTSRNEGGMSYMNMKTYCAIGAVSLAIGLAIGALLGAAIAFLFLGDAYL